MTDIGRRRGATFATLIALIALVTLAAVLTGCAVGPNYVKPATPVAPQFEGTTAGAFSPDEAQARFWTQFGDATLDHLIDDALVANHDLRIALAHLVEARAERHEAQFDFAPTVTASGGYTKQQFPAVRVPRCRARKPGCATRRCRSPPRSRAPTSSCAVSRRGSR